MTFEDGETCLVIRRCLRLTEKLNKENAMKKSVDREELKKIISLKIDDTIRKMDPEGGKEHQSDYAQAQIKAYQWVIDFLEGKVPRPTPEPHQGRPGQ